MKIDLGEALLSILTAIAAVVLFAISAPAVSSVPQTSSVTAFIGIAE